MAQDWHHQIKISSSNPGISKNANKGLILKRKFKKSRSLHSRKLMKKNKMVCKKLKKLIENSMERYVQGCALQIHEGHLGGRGSE